MRRFNISKVYFGASRTYGIDSHNAHTHTRGARARARAWQRMPPLSGAASGALKASTHNNKKIIPT